MPRNPDPGLLRHGIDDGTLRGGSATSDQPPLWWPHPGSRADAVQGGIGVERAAAMVSTVFLEGTAARSPL